MALNSTNAYLRTKVMTAGPGELRLMLFDGAIKFAEQARDGLTRKDYESMHNGIIRCQDIVLELINGLRPEHNPELCDRLSALYTFIYTRLIEASTQRDVTVIDEAIELLRFERETWAMVLEKLSAENTNAGGMTSTPPAPKSVAAQPSAGLVGSRVSVKG